MPHSYHLGKTNMVADALSYKSSVCTVQSYGATKRENQDHELKILPTKKSSYFATVSLQPSILERIKEAQLVVLPVASSGIASLLLPIGRTKHSRFGIPLQVHENSICSRITTDSDLTTLLKLTKLIIWDEAPMTHKYYFEALDRSMRDVIRSFDGHCVDKPYGGKVIVFGGYFRQILSVILKGNRQDIVNASLCSSYLWDSCEVLKLTKNMRLQSVASPSDVSELKDFADWILQIGDGIVGGPNDGEAKVQLSKDILISDALNPVESIINNTYPNILDHLDEEDYFKNRVVLAPTNDIVEDINNYILSLMPGEDRVYLSVDSICVEEGQFNRDYDIYSVEFLNAIKYYGMPNHNITLKVAPPIMLLRNIDQSKELCNDTRLIISTMGNHVVSEKLITGRFKGEELESLELS